jgi:hypothetical protein
MVCRTEFRTFESLKKHAAQHKSGSIPSTSLIPCMNCDKKFPSRSLLKQHLKQNCVSWKIPDTTHMLNTTYFKVTSSSALQGCLVEYHLVPKHLCSTEVECLNEAEDGVRKALIWLIENGIEVKWGYEMEATFEKYTSDGERHTKKALFSLDKYASDNTQPERIRKIMDEDRSSFTQRIEKFTNEGSGWILVSINRLTVQFARFCSMLAKP